MRSTVANLEITAPLVLSTLAALASLLGATAAISRRTRDWDDVEKIKKIVIDGDPENDRPSLLSRVKTLEDDTEEIKADREADALQVKYIKRALSAHGSDEHAIADAVRDYVGRQAKEHVQGEVAAAAASEVRRALIKSQNERFEPRSEHAAPHPPYAPRLSVYSEDDPFPSSKAAHSSRQRTLTPYKQPIPRSEPVSSDPPPLPPPPPDRRRR